MPASTQLYDLDKEPIPEILNGLAEHSDREAAMVGAALVEALLRRAIKARFVSVDDHDRVFDPGRPLNSMYSMTYIAYLLGIIPKSLRSDIEKIGEIRNRFAHDFGNWKFDIAIDKFNFPEKCKSLRLPDNYEEVLNFVTKGKFSVSDVNNIDKWALAIVDDCGFVGAFSPNFSREGIPAGKECKFRFLSTIYLCWVVFVADYCALSA